MIKVSFATIAVILIFAVSSFAQNSNTRTARQRTTTRQSTQPSDGNSSDDEQTQSGASTTENRKTGGARSAGSVHRTVPANKPTPGTVTAAFQSLIDGIRSANVDQVMNVYLNSPKLLLFNNNGTITRGWEQVRKNRLSSYPNRKEVKLDVHDLNVQMLGPDAALITCLWTQSGVYKGSPETASGRMTIIFRHFADGWKAIHLHSSPDAPDQSRGAQPQESSTPAPTPKTTPKPVLTNP